MEPSRLIPLRVDNPTLWDVIYDAARTPAMYVAHSVKAILDERDSVPKTRWKIFNPGRKCNGSIWLLMYSARFRWKEPLRDGEDYLQSIEEAYEAYHQNKREIVKYAQTTRDHKEAKRLLHEEGRQLVNTLEGGILSDGVTDCPINPILHMDRLSNNQKIYYLLMTYGPSADTDVPMMMLGYCQDHSNLPRSTAKRSLWDHVLPSPSVPELLPQKG